MKNPSPRRSAKPGVAGKPTFGKSADGKRSFAKPAPAGKRRPFGEKPAPGEKRPFGDKPAYGEKRPFGEKPGFGEKRPFGDKPAFGEKRAFGAKRPFGEKRPAAQRPFTAKHEDEIVPSQRPDFATPMPQQARRRRLEPGLDFDDVIYGLHAVDEALRSGEKLKRLYIGREREREVAVRDMVLLAKAQQVEILFEAGPFFSRFPYKAHQNIVAIGEPFAYISLDEAIALRKTQRLIVLLDHLTDPHNVGAILRTAECAGAQAVVLPDRRSAGINATVRKGAAGAASHLPVAKVGNISAAIRALKAANFTVVGAALEERSVALSAATLGDDVALVIGAEGTGLSKLVAKNCDELVKIPLLGKVESLNASVATGVLLYEIVRRRMASAKE